MTTLSYFKQNLLEIEQKLRGLQDTDQNSIKIRMDVMTDLYCVLHSKQAVTYFMSIYRRTGAHNATIAKDIEDYISEALQISAQIEAFFIKRSLQHFGSGVI